MSKNLVTVEKLTFESGGIACTGYLYQIKTESPLPCIIMGAGFGGTQDTPSMIAAANSFAEAGFAAFTFDYRNLGESGGEPRQLVNIQGQQEDFLAAIDFIKGVPTVDSNRLALWGSSLGGGHVVAVAAKSPDISAVISQIPFNGFPKNNGRSLKETVRLLRAMYKDQKCGKKGEAPFYIQAVGKTGELAVMASEDAAKTIAGMQSKTWRNEIAPRALFEMMKYKPSDTANQVKAKVMICYGEFDKETQGPQTMELIQSLPNVEAKSYPVAHFEFYQPNMREGIINDQIAFLKECLSS